MLKNYTSKLTECVYNAKFIKILVKENLFIETVLLLQANWIFLEKHILTG